MGGAESRDGRGDEEYLLESSSAASRRDRSRKAAKALKVRTLLELKEFYCNRFVVSGHYIRVKCNSIWYGTVQSGTVMLV